MRRKPDGFDGEVVAVPSISIYIPLLAPDLHLVPILLFRHLGEPPLTVSP